MSDQAKTPTAGRDSVAHTLIVALGLSLVCSVLVASTAVILKPVQERNELRYRQQIINQVAGLGDGGDAVIEARMVDLATGRYLDAPDPAQFDPVVAASDPQTGVAIEPDQDIAGLRRRARYAPVYLVTRQQRLEQVILPIYGKGLWSTMYGYLALDADGNTVRGLRFYQHAETPGLGDQIEDASWRQQWVGKQVFGADGQPRIEVIRGMVATGQAESTARYQIDGLSGATLTGRGVTRLVHYWVGPDGFGPFLNQIAGDTAP